MRRLLRLANSQKGLTSPNPITAAAIVDKSGEIISEGVHSEFGGPHAEALAIKKAGIKAKGCTIYVNLEPCTHTGKNPPCTDLIIEAGIKKVIYAIDDPNPLVRKISAKTILNKAGIKVESGLLHEEALLINEVFIKNQTKKLPFVVMKVGTSLDGKIALANGKSKYITAIKSQKKVHKIRRELDAILVGVGTIVKDDPALNIRHTLLKPGYKNPVKIILDSKARTPLDAKIFNENKDTKIIIATTRAANKNKVQLLKKKAEIWILPNNRTAICWNSLLKKAYKEEIMSILIEGGNQVYTSALAAGVIDKLYLFQAPKIIAEEKALSIFSGENISSLNNVNNLRIVSSKKCGPDICITAYFEKK